MLNVQAMGRELCLHAVHALISPSARRRYRCPPIGPQGSGKKSTAGECLIACLSIPGSERWTSLESDVTPCAATTCTGRMAPRRRRAGSVLTDMTIGGKPGYSGAFVRATVPITKDIAQSPGSSQDPFERNSQYAHAERGEHRDACARTGPL